MIAAVDQDRDDVELAPIAEPIVEMWPLKGLLPTHIGYEVARRACERGELVAKKPGGRWFCTEAAMATWIASTGRGKK